MRKLMKSFGFFIGRLLVVAAIASTATFLISENRLKATYEVPSNDMPFETSMEIVDSGNHLTLIRGCTDYHGVDLGGAAVLDDLMLGASLTWTARRRRLVWFHRAV